MKIQVYLTPPELWRSKLRGRVWQVTRGLRVQGIGQIYVRSFLAYYILVQWRSKRKDRFFEYLHVPIPKVLHDYIAHRWEEKAKLYMEEMMSEIFEFQD